MKNWVRPMAVEEAFVANTTVSVCYSLTCTLPGKDPYTEDGHDSAWITNKSVADRGNVNEIWGHQTFRKGIFGEDIVEKHDSCAYPAYWNEDTQTFHESGMNKAPVSNVQVAPGSGKRAAIWNSTYQGLTYHHIGYAIDESAAHPNRS